MSQRVFVFSKFRNQDGYTLTEIIVVLLIVSILASVSVLQLEKKIQRDREKALIETLMKTREAIDLFHQDWSRGLMDRRNAAASVNGYPRSLDVLIEPIEIKIDNQNITRRYLRDLPENPFAQAQSESDDMWQFRSSTDSSDSNSTNGLDVFDLYSKIERTAINGTEISEW